MKKLIVALFASATALFASAKVLTQEDFEEGLGSFTGTGGTLVRYDSDCPENYPYPFSSAGSSYCDIDADVETFDSPSSSAAYFDMNVKFTVREAVSQEDLADAKLAVYLNSENKIVVRSRSGEYVTGLEVDSSGWARLTIAKVAGGFKVYIDDEVVQENDEDKVFVPINNVGETLQVAFDGKGALDNFVARTTDPFIADQDVAATIGDEGYASYNDALKDALTYKTSSETLTITVDDTEMDGTAAKPYQIATVADLIALKDAVLANEYVRSLNFVQTADIDMASAGAFAGIGTYAANPTDGTPFTGTYDGGNFKILNVDFTQRNYGGIFNQVNGGTIKDLTVSNITCSTYSRGEFGFAIIGNAGNGAVLTNIVAEGVFASAAQPATHNIAGIVVRASAGGTGTLIKDCVNNAALHGAYTKAAGICALTQAKVSGGVVAFDGCENNGSVSMYDDKVVDESKHAGQDGLAGIVGYVDCNTTIKDCENAGALSSTYETAKVGQIVGWAYTKDSSSVRSLTDLGGNAAPSDARMVGSVSTLANVTGFQYATVDNNDVATTIAPPYTLAKDTTYLLEGNVAASATPVFTLEAAGDTFKVDTALGYTFAGTVAASSSLGVAGPKVDGTVSTYSAGVAAVDDIAYAIFAEAVAARADDEDVVTLLADMSARFILNSQGTQKMLKVKTNGLDCKVVSGADDVLGYSTVDGVTTYVSELGVAIFAGTKYASLSSAIAAAAAATGDDKTVKLLSNISLDARVEPNLGSGKSLTIDLGGKTITRTGTSGNGSVFDVKSGNVVITNGVIDCTQDDAAIVADGVYAITARPGANVTLDTLTVTVDSECGACVYPFVNENGVGAYIYIRSGTYENLTTTPYRYKPAWTGMTVNQANKDKMGGYATSLVNISGGRFKGVDPALGDDSWDDGEGSFVMDSCMTVPEDGYYVVRDAVYVSFMLRLETTPAEVGFLSVTKILKGTTVARPAQDPSTNGYTFVGWYTRHENPDNDYIPEWDSDPFDFNTPIVRDTTIWARFEVASAPSGIDAGQSETVEVDTTKPQEEQEQDAIDAVTLNITVPEAVAEAVSGLTQSDYQDYFKKVATPGTGADEGKWVVTAELDETKVFTATESEEAATEQSILDAALDEGSTTATVQAAKPGLYYSMEASNDIGFAAGEGTLEGDRTLATSETVSVEKPEQLPQGNAVFFRVRVSRTDK